MSAPDGADALGGGGSEEVGLPYGEQEALFVVFVVDDDDVEGLFCRISNQAKFKRSHNKMLLRRTKLKQRVQEDPRRSERNRILDLNSWPLEEGGWPRRQLKMTSGCGSS